LIIGTIIDILIPPCPTM